jgi:hypothetical protein
MTFRFQVLAMIGAAALTACATDDVYGQHMDKWRGRDSADLAVNWGAPDNTSALPGGRQAWDYSRATITKTEGHYRDNTRTVTQLYNDKDGQVKEGDSVETYSVWVPPKTTRATCDTHFVVGADRRIEQVSFKGAGCVVPPAS